MIDQKKRAYHFETSSLQPLKSVLIEAEKESPPRAPMEKRDRNEELALKLITSMKKKYKQFVFKPLSLEVECGEHKVIEKETALEP